MASIVLGTIGSVVGSGVAGPLSTVLGSPFANFVGSSITSAFTNRPQRRHIEGARLEQLAVQTSTFGRGIPSFFGTMRLAGNVIWSLPIREVASTTTVRTGGKGGRSAARTTTQVSYSYFVTMAIAIGEGPITRLERVWADAKQLDLGQGTYRVHHGDEDQLPDSLIESIEGVGRTPAYRGLSYVVLEDFPLASFGNRIPNFTFEVTRNAAIQSESETPLEEQIESVVLLPGSCEYVYDTLIANRTDGVEVGSNFVQQGYRQEINANTANGKADALVALDQLQDALPNADWVALTVNWFADSTNITGCNVYPAIEFQSASLISPNPWNVAGLTRANARLIGQDNGRPRYGGTPDDESIVRLVDELKARGKKVFFYPLMLMDIAGKPWRGTLTGDAAEVSNFFNKSGGYNAYILHYANLMKNRADAFAIGTEMIALTSITDAPGSYPAVNEFINLAAAVKSIMGGSTLVTYAADWSEYHHTTGGWYHLDPLWASPNIDVVGIDCYFPLTDKPEASITRQDIVDGWTSGEGYDWVYTDATRTSTQPIAPEYAWKNIDWWWHNNHVNPDSATTPWVPMSKPIWFAEIGYASVDGTTNQPNVFIDPTTAASSYPRFSRERVDFAAQRTALEVAEEVWKDSEVVTKRFVWAWDMRPYPAWPDLLDVWADGGNWLTGHWVQGKLGASQLRAIVSQLLLRAGLNEDQFDVTALNGQVDGLIINERSTIRAVLEQLQIAYAFDLRESGGKVVAVNRDEKPIATISTTELIAFEQGNPNPFLEYRRQEELELPKRVEVRYLDRFEDYGTSVQSAERDTKRARDTETVSLSIALVDSVAKSLADRVLYERWIARDSWRFQLPMRYAALEVGDVITLEDDAFSAPLVINEIQLGRPGLLRIRASLHEANIYDQYIHPVVRGADPVTRLAPTEFRALDIPALPNETIDEHGLKLAFSGIQADWPGAVLLRESLVTGNRNIVLSHNLQSDIGVTTTALPDMPSANVFDETSSVEVILMGEGALESTTREALLNGANAAVIGDEIIQFADVETLGAQHFRLSGLLRGRLGTEFAGVNHDEGERFVLLNDTITSYPLNSADIGQGLTLLAVTSGLTEQDATTQQLTYQARALKPYAPVHLAARKLAGGDIIFSWVRRTRINGEWRDFVDVPLNEESEAYQIDILDGSNVLRSEQTNLSEFTYSVADQITDTGAALNNVGIRVAQLSSLIGPGNTAEASFSW